MVSFCEGIAIPLKWYVPTGRAIWARGYIIHIGVVSWLFMLSHWPRAKMNKQCPEFAVAQQVGVCSASRHWCSSQIACPYLQCHSSKGFHHRYLDPLVGHRDNHTELRPEMVSFCERYGYSIQMACPYRPCYLNKGLHHPYSYALDR